MIKENKNVDPASARNYARYVMATNNDWPAKVEIGDRRYFCLEMSTSKIGDTDYINQFVELMHNDIAGKIVYEYLLNRKITWNPRQIPMTAFRQDLMKRSAPNINSFFEYLGSDEYEEPPTPLLASFMPPQEDGWIVEKPKNIYTQYASWFKQNHYHQSQFCDAKTFRKALDDLVAKHPVDFYIKERNWVDPNTKRRSKIITFGARLSKINDLFGNKPLVVRNKKIKVI
jgi:hypothetical protein